MRKLCRELSKYKMGLYASFNPEQLGYPLRLEQEIMGELVVVQVDYGPACDAFCETFIEVATDLVPVDTGYLESTIDASTDGYFCECYADAEYAQYVEYGTWKMSAQPYFTPAVQEGIEAFIGEAGDILEEATEEMRELCEEVMAAAFSGFSEDFIGNAVDMILGGLLMLLAFPILVYIHGILDSLNPGGGNGHGGGVGIDVIIT